MIRTKGFIWSVVILVGMVSVLYAPTLRIWKVSTKEELIKGEPLSTSISSEGKVTLAPTVQEIYAPPEPYLWSAVVDSKGNLYVGSGNEGKVFKIDSEGKGRLFFDSEELEIHTLLVDKNDNLLVATSPNGKLYRITPEGSASTLFEPREKYIWSLAMDQQGNLYAGTGIRGRIFKIDSQGKGELFWESQQTHITTLTIDNKGNLLAGSDPGGHVYRISPQGKGFVLYDSPLQEVHCVVCDERGNIYAAAIAGKAAPPQEKKEAPSASVRLSMVEKEAQKAPATLAPTTPTEIKSAIYRISPEGEVEVIWEANTVTVHSLTLDAKGNLLVGTGDKGYLLSIDPSGSETLLAKLKVKQLSSLFTTSGGEIWIATSNLGKVFKMSPNYPLVGIYESTPYDTVTTSQWGNLWWKGTKPSGTNIKLYTRSGNTEKPDNNWSGWSPPYNNEEGSPIISPPARFIQWKGELTTQDPSITPTLESLSLAYLQQNLKPQIINITIHPPGIYYKKPSPYEDELLANLPEEFESAYEKKTPTTQAGGEENLGRKAYKKGVRTISWQATDGNEDRLVFNLYFRGIDEERWMVLKEDLTEPVYTWDTFLVPEGSYVVRIEASDAPSNPDGLSLSARQQSAPFDIDNNPPQIVNFSVRPSVKNIEVSFSVRDSYSFLRLIAYSLNAGEWKRVHPKDGLLDSKEEAFQLTIPSPPVGEHILVVKAEDGMYNIGTGKAVFRVGR